MCPNKNCPGRSGAEAVVRGFGECCRQAIWQVAVLSRPGQMPLGVIRGYSILPSHVRGLGLHCGRALGCPRDMIRRESGLASGARVAEVGIIPRLLWVAYEAATGVGGRFGRSRPAVQHLSHVSEIQGSDSDAVPVPGRGGGRPSNCGEGCPPLSAAQVHNRGEWAPNPTERVRGPHLIQSCSLGLDECGRLARRQTRKGEPKDGQIFDALGEMLKADARRKGRVVSPVMVATLQSAAASWNGVTARRDGHLQSPTSRTGTASCTGHLKAPS
ncbi:MAG: hypothetical protein ACR2PW_04710 [Gammaproteobacteria bacterium]